MIEIKERWIQGALTNSGKGVGIKILQQNQEKKIAMNY